MIECCEPAMKIRTNLPWALSEVLAHVRGEVDLPCRFVDDPAAERILALRKRLGLSRQKFADRFGLDARALQDSEQGRRVLDLGSWLRGLRDKVHRWTGIPVSIGAGPTKTLAKLANRLAKSSPRTGGVLDLAYNPAWIEPALRGIALQRDNQAETPASIRMRRDAAGA